jgi:AcrR family transcriptional regulator
MNVSPDPAGASDRAGGAGLLWEQSARPARKPRVGLSLDRIARAGIEIADAEGIDAISMQRVAGELGFTKMSLYRYVASKAELLAVMIDLAVGEPPDLGAVPGGWRARLEEVIRQLTEIWRRHPWLPVVTVGARMMGPRETGWTESMVAALADTELTGDERLAASFLIFGHIRNTQSMELAGTQPWTTDGALTEVVRARAEAFPALNAALTAAASTTGTSTTGTAALADNGRRFGLDRILEGIAALIAERS